MSYEASNRDTWRQSEMQNAALRYGAAQRVAGRGDELHNGKLHDATTRCGGNTKVVT